MTKNFSRRKFLWSALSSGVAMSGLPACANAPERSLRPVGRGAGFIKQIQTPAEALIADANLGGAVGFCVANVRTGEVLEEHEGALRQPPASVAKAMTAAYALDVLGPGHHFETRIVATGGIQGGVVGGDLILVGGGDPTLDTDALAAMAAQLKSAGIVEVKGRFKVWGGALPQIRTIDPEQPDHVGYSPAVSGLNLNYNRVHFEWRRSGGSYSVTMDARSERHRPAVAFARMAVEGRSLPVYTYADRSGRDEWSVARGALGDGGARWLPVRKPEIYAGEVFQTFARSHGLVLSAPVMVAKLPEGATVVRHQSAPLRIILRDMLKWSTNLTAESVGMMATAKATGRVPPSLSASAKAMDRWAREAFGLTTMSFVDHSGLGERSRISAKDMMQALRKLRQDSGLKPLLKPFFFRDSQGRLLKNHPTKVHAKTGTLNFVSGLAGFVDLPDGTELVFAIFASNMDRRAGLSKNERERPPGGASWNRRAKGLQQALIERWSVLYAA